MINCVINNLKEAVVTLLEALEKRPRDYGTQGIYNILGTLVQLLPCTIILIILLYYVLGKAFDNIGDVQNAEYYYQLSIKEKHVHLPVIINYSRFLIEHVRNLANIVSFLIVDCFALLGVT